eukprot:SM000017S02759  [mRNA]  locus=s17:114220:115831:+ [translate_table: standard]
MWTSTVYGGKLQGDAEIPSYARTNGLVERRGELVSSKGAIPPHGFRGRYVCHCSSISSAQPEPGQPSPMPAQPPQSSPAGFPPWTVPWKADTILQMFLWFAAFWLVGSWAIPMAAHAVGCNRAVLTYRGQALYSLVTDLAEMTIGLTILHRCLARFQPLPHGWFPVNFRGRWYMETLLGCLMFPTVNLLSQININLVPFPLPGAFPTTTHFEQSLVARDPIAVVLYVVVVSVCAPIWEEVIFRGFLLASLTRYLPVWAAVGTSALAFALAHFSLQRLLPLYFLGIVIGVVYVRSRNLLASMVLHSLWNTFVFLELLRC